MWVVRTCGAKDGVSEDSVIRDNCYEPSNSQTKEILEQNSSIRFGRGSLTGNWGTDSLWMGDYEIKSQHMAMAQQSDAFSDGTGVLLGLGYPSMSAFGFTPVFDTLMNIKVLPKNIFSFWLSLNTDVPSSLVFGKVEPERFEGDIKYYPVIDKQFWTIKMIDVLVRFFFTIINILCLDGKRVTRNLFRRKPMQCSN